MTKKDVIALANEKGWELVADQEASFVLIFRKDTAKLNIWYTKMTVATTIDHPTKARKQLFRKCISEKELKAIMDNPRVHTRKGFYTKMDFQKRR